MSLADNLNGMLHGAASAVVRMTANAGAKVSSSGMPEEIKEAEAFYKDSLEEQRSYHATWYSNIACYMGLQWMDWDNTSNWLIEPPRPSWRVRMVANLILPMVRAEAGKILKSNPNIRVVPANDSEEARAGAKIGDRVMDAKYYEDEYQRKLYNLVMWMLTCGSAFMWSLWDPTRGKGWSDIQKDPNGLPIIDPNTGLPARMDYNEGDTVDDVSNVFETFLERGGSEDFNEHRSIMRVKIRSVDYVKDKYGVEVKAEDISQQVMFQQRVASLVTMSGPFGGTMALPKLKNMCMIKERFMLPDSKHPQGGHLMYVGSDYLVEPEDLDYYYHGERALPVGKFDHITIPGRPIGMSSVEQVKNLNQVFNKMNSQAVENGNLLARPKILAPQGSLDEDQWTDQPGEVVEYLPVAGMKPEGFKPPEMPEYFFRMKDSIPGLIQLVSGIHDASLGKLPRRATSGKAIDALQDADDSAMGITVKNFGSSLERIQSIKLATIGRKYREQRIVKKMGSGHDFEILQFRGADLRDADTVRCTMGVALTRSSKVNLAMQLVENEMIDKEMAMKVLELGDLNVVFDQNSEQSNYAQFENMGMAKGISYPTGAFENQQVHLKVHKNFQKTAVYEKLPPEVKAIFDAHNAEHEARIQATLAPPSPVGVAGANVPRPGPAGPGPSVARGQA